MKIGSEIDGNGQMAASPETATRHAWLLTIAMILVAMDLRPGIVSIGPVLPAIIDTFGMTHAVASLMTSIPTLLMGSLALPTPWLVRRFGVDRVLQSALAILCVATLARAFAPNTAVLLAGTVGVGVGIAVAGALFAGVIKTRFPDRVALMMGVYATAISFGSALSAGTTGWVAQTVGAGWRVATGMWSVSGVIAIAAWWLVMRAQRGEPVVRSRVVTGGLPVRNKTAWGIAFYFACVNFLFYSILTWTAPMYQEHGLSPARAGLILASFTTAFMLSSPLIGMFSKSTDRRAWLGGCAALALVGVIGMVSMQGRLPFLWLPVCAFGLGGAFTLGMTLPLDNTHTADETNRWNAFILTIGCLVAAVGPLSLGYVRDLTGNFGLPFGMLIGVAVLMLGVTPFLKPHR